MKKLLVLIGVAISLVIVYFSWPRNTASHEEVVQTSTASSGSNVVIVSGVVIPAGISSDVRFARPTNDARATLVARGILQK